MAAVQRTQSTCLIDPVGLIVLQLRSLIITSLENEVENNGHSHEKTVLAAGEVRWEGVICWYQAHVVYSFMLVQC